MGRYAADMLAEERSTARQSRWALDIALPSSTLRYAPQSWPAVGVGNYRGYLLSVDRFSRGSPDKDFRLTPSQIAVTLNDTDGTLIQAARGRNGGSFRGSHVTLWRGTQNSSVPSADWLPVFVGIAYDYEVSAPFQFKLYARSDDRLLSHYLSGVITRADWPNADKAAVGQISPRIYGVMDSVLDGGAVKCPLVDINANTYLVARGWIKSVDEVYSAGVLQASGWTASYTTRNGRRYTVVVFTSSQGSNAVTADVQGYTDAADRSGTLIQDPTDAIKHFLVNWVFANSGAGYKAESSWFLDSSAPIDTTYFASAKTYTSAHGYKASRWIGGQNVTGLAVLNEWTGGLKIRPVWTGAGNLALRIWDHGIANTSIYVDSPKVNGQRDSKAFRVAFEVVDQMSQVTVNFARNEVSDAYIQSLNVRDPTIQNAGAVSLNVPWSYGGA